jgi:hypothetical protein
MTYNPVNYDLNPEAKAFSYTREELFECITKIITYPLVITTDSERAKAAAIFMVFNDYLENYTESDNNGGHYVAESDATDFEGYVMERFGYLNYGDASATEVMR